MIKQKNKKCIECGREDLPHFSRKRCIYCAKKSYGKIKKTSVKRKTGKNVKKESLAPFFQYHISKIKQNPICMNCGCRLHGTVSEVAHILPKREFMNPEVRSNLDNALYLCCDSNSNCHGLFDNIQMTEKVYEMEVWEIAVKKYKKLKPFLKNINSITEIFESFLQ